MRPVLRVPEDVALAGFDDLDFAAELDPPLTTVRQDIQQQGAEAAGALVQLLQDTRRRAAAGAAAHRAGHPTVDDGRCDASLTEPASTAWISIVATVMEEETKMMPRSTTDRHCSPSWS